MTEREPIEVTNLDRYGSSEPCRGAGRATILRPARTAPGVITEVFLGTSRPDGRPHAAGIGALWHDGDVYFTSGPGTRKSRNLAENPACTISMSLEGIDLVLEGEATRVTDRPTLEAVAGLYRERRVAGGGGGRRVHGAVQRAERRTTALVPLPLHLPHGLRRRHRRAVRRDPLAVLGRSPHPPTRHPLVPARRRQERGDVAWRRRL